MQLHIVFERNAHSNAYFIVGIADNQPAADVIASHSLAKGIEYSAYTDDYEFDDALGRDCFVVYAKNNWVDPTAEGIDPDREVFGKLYYTEEMPSAADVFIFNNEEIAVQKADRLLSDIGAETYEHFDKLEPYCVNVRINDLVDY